MNLPEGALKVPLESGVIDPEQLAYKICKREQGSKKLFWFTTELVTAIT